MHWGGVISVGSATNGASPSSLAYGAGFQANIQTFLFPLPGYPPIGKRLSENM